MINALRKKLELYASNNYPSRILVGGLPDFVLEQIASSWQSSNQLFLVTSKELPKTPNNVKLIRADDLTRERIGSWVALVTSNESGAIVESVRGAASGTVTEVWKDRFPWTPCNLPGLRWEDVLKEWADSVGLKSEIDRVSQCINQLLNELKSQVNSAETFFQVLNEITKSSLSPDDVCFHVGIARHEAGQILRRRGIHDSVLVVQDQFIDRFKDIVAESACSELVNTAKLLYSNDTSKCSEVISAVEYFTEGFRKLGPNELETGVLAWRSILRGNRKYWDTLDHATLSELVDQMRYKAKLGIKLENGDGVQFHQIGENNIITRDLNVPSPLLGVQVTFPERLLEEANISSNQGVPYRLFSKVNNKVERAEPDKLPDNPGPQVYKVKLSTAGRQVIKLLVGENEFSEKAASTSEIVWSCCQDYPLIICANSKVRVTKCKKNYDEEGSEYYAVNQNIILPIPGRFTFHVFIYDLYGDPNATSTGEPEKNLMPQVTRVENTPCYRGIIPMLEVSEGTSLSIEWKRSDGKEVRAQVDFSFKEEGEMKTDSLTAALLQSHGGKKVTEVKNTLEQARQGKLALDQIPVKESTRSISRLEVLQRDTEHGWKPFLFSLGDDLVRQVPSFEAIRVRGFFTSEEVRLHEQANPWANTISHNIDIKKRPSCVDKYVSLRSAVINKLRDQFDDTPGVQLEIDQLARKAYIGCLDKTLLAEYLEVFLSIMREVKEDTIDPEWKWFSWCLDTVLLFEQQSVAPTVGLIGPYHPITLTRLFFLQECLGERLRKNSRSSLASYFSRLQALSLGYLPNAQLNLAKAISFPSGDNHWLIIYRQQQESQLPTERVLKWLRASGLDPRVGPAGIDEQVLPDTVAQYLYAYPSRQTIRLLLEDCSQRSFSLLRDALVKEDELTELGKKIPGGISVFDPRSRITHDDEGSTLTYDADIPITWYHSQPRSGLPIDIETLQRSETVDFVTSEMGGTYSRLSPLARKQIVHANKKGQLDMGVTLKSKDQETSLEGTYLQVIREYEPTGEQLVWGTPITSNSFERANWTLCSASQVDPRLFIDHVLANPGKALWTYRVFGFQADEKTEVSSGHYLIAKVSPTLTSSLSNLLSTVDLKITVNDLLFELARSGLTLGDEFLRTGKKAEGAFGQFLLLRAIWQPPGNDSVLPHWELDQEGRPTSAGFVIQVDPFSGILSTLYHDTDTRESRDSKADSFSQRGDLISFQVKFCEDALWIKPVVFESKYSPSGQVDIPSALEQARSTARHIDRLLEFCIHDVNKPVLPCWSQPERLFLTELFFLGLRLSAGSFTGQGTRWHEFEARVLQEVLSGNYRRIRAKSILIAHHAGDSTNSLDEDEPNAFISFNDIRNYPSGYSTEAFQSILKALTTAVRVKCDEQETVFEAKPETIVEVVLEPTEETEDEEIRAEFEAAGEEKQIEEVSREPEKPMVDKEARSKAHARFDDMFQDFIGNEQTISKLRDDLVYALLKDPPQLALAFLFTGNPSTGKTTLSKKIAALVGAPFVYLVGTNIKGPDSLVEQVDKALKAAKIEPKKLPEYEQGIPEYEYPPVIIFIDEVHLVKGKDQEGLLTLTEPRERYIRLKDRICHFPYATFIGATTRDSELDKALRSRFGNPIHLSDYTVQEVARILEIKNPSWSSWPDETRESIARLARSVPREAERLAERLERKMQVALEELTLEEALEKLRIEEGLDRNGLDKLSWLALQTLAKEMKPIGKELTAQRMAIADEQKLTDEIIPALQRMGLVNQVAGGQVITDQGRNYLRNEKPPQK